MATLSDLNQAVRDTFEQARESLARLEGEAQRQDRPALHSLSQAYARLLSPLRDYITGVTMNRPLPRQLAKRVQEPFDAFIDHEDEIRALGLHPDPDELTVLVKLAESAT